MSRDALLERAGDMAFRLGYGEKLVEDLARKLDRAYEGLHSFPTRRSSDYRKSVV